MRRAAHTDDNQAEIVRCVRKLGASVQSLASVGSGVPDLLVGYRGRNYLFEIKNPKQDACKRRLRVGQSAWHQAWRGHVQVATCWQDIAYAIGAFRTGAPEQLTLEDAA